MNRRGFFKLLAGAAAAHLAKPLLPDWRTLWRPADLVYISPFAGHAVYYSYRFTIGLPPHSGQHFRNIKPEVEDCAQEMARNAGAMVASYIVGDAAKIV